MSSYISFTLRKGHCPAVKKKPNYHTTNRSSKILRTTVRLEVKLETTYRPKKKKKANQLKNKRDQPVDREKIPSIENKSLVYRAVIKRIWSYGIELWGCINKSNIVIVQNPNPKFSEPWQIHPGI